MEDSNNTNNTHKPHKIFIKNRDGLNVRVCIDSPVTSTSEVSTEASRQNAPFSQNGLVFIMPGLGSYHTKPEFRAIAEICTRHGYTAVSFDPTHSFGESEGEYADATLTGYITDLEDVIEWASKELDVFAQEQNLNIKYADPFILVGHSLGAMSVAYYTERFPEKVKALVPLSTTISGQLSIDARGPEETEKWKTLGYQEHTRTNGQINKLKWSHMEDRLKYDLLKNDSASKIAVPFLMIVGESDPMTPPKHQELLFDAVATPTDKKELHILKNEAHNIRHNLGRADVLPEVKEIFEKWLIKLG